MFVTLLLAVVSCHLVVVSGEAGFIPGSPPTSVVSSGRPIPPPQTRPHTKIIESYLSSEVVFGSPPPPSSLPKFRAYSSPQNSLSLDSENNDEPKQPFEVVRAPVIYHHTVTDTDVTQALADAFNVVDNLRKPGDKITHHEKQRVPLGTLEFVNHFPDGHRTTYATTTTTIVEEPQHINVLSSGPSNSINAAQVSITTDAKQDQFHPLPAAVDIPPPPPPSITVTNTVPTTATVASNPVPVAPATSTSTAPVLLASPAPKLLIPSQQHVTTLDQAVRTTDPFVRTIIQPVYIPYPVDQNGQPVGPLPDYQTMDFNALLSAQKHLLLPSPSAATSTTSGQFLLSNSPVQIVQQSQPIHQTQQNYYTYQTVEDQGVAANSPNAATVLYPTVASSSSSENKEETSSSS